MKNFSVSILTNGEALMQLDFNFGGNYEPESKSEIIGTISKKFFRFMEMNKRWKIRTDNGFKSKISSSDALDIVINHNSEQISTEKLTALFGAKFCFRFNKTIEAKFEHFLSDAFDLCSIDEITEANHI